MFAKQKSSLFVLCAATIAIAITIAFFREFAGADGYKLLLPIFVLPPLMFVIFSAVLFLIIHAINGFHKFTAVAELEANSPFAHDRLPTQIVPPRSENQPQL